MCLDRMPQSNMVVDLVAIPATNPLSFEHSRFFQFLDNSLHSTLCDSHTGGDFPEEDFRLTIKQHQNMRVIREESPAGKCRGTDTQYCGRRRRFCCWGIFSHGGVEETVRQ